MGFAVAASPHRDRIGSSPWWRFLLDIQRIRGGRAVSREHDRSVCWIRVGRQRHGHTHLPSVEERRHRWRHARDVAGNRSVNLVLR